MPPKTNKERVREYRERQKRKREEEMQKNSISKPTAKSDKERAREYRERKKRKMKETQVSVPKSDKERAREYRMRKKMREAALEEQMKVDGENTEYVASHKTAEFSGSKGWFQKFKKRVSLNNMKMRRDMALTDEIEDKKYFEQLYKIAEENSYRVFSTDNSDLVWKRMPFIKLLSETEKSATELNTLCSISTNDYDTVTTRANIPTSENVCYSPMLENEYSDSTRLKCQVRGKEFDDATSNELEESMVDTELNAAELVETVFDSTSCKSEIQSTETVSKFTLSILNKGLVVAKEQKYPKQLCKIAEENSYRVFSTDNSDLFWKRMPFIKLPTETENSATELNTLCSISTNDYDTVMTKANIPTSENECYIPMLENEYSDSTRLKCQVRGEEFDDATSNELEESMVDTELNAAELVETVFDSTS